MLILLSVSAVIIIFTWIAIIHTIIKSKRLKASDAIYINQALKNRVSILFKLYHFFDKFIVTQGYIRRLRRRYEILCPGDQKEIARKTISLALTVWTLCTVVLIGIFLRRPTIYTAAITILLVFVINTELINRVVRKAEIKLLVQLDKFLSDVRHYYYTNGAVDDAILDTLEQTGREMRIQAEKIFEILTAENIEDEVSKYNDTTHNNFLKMFLAQCVSVINYGDKDIEDESLFLRNIKNLKIDINIEIQKLKKIDFLFSGLVYINIGPVLTLNMIKDWAIYNLPSLESFYNGLGVVLMVIIFVFTVIVYIMNNHLKEIKNLIPKDYGTLEKVSQLPIIKPALVNYEEKNFGKFEIQRDMLKRMGESITPKQLLVQRIIYAFLTFILLIIFTLSLHHIRRQDIASNIGNVEQLTTAANTSQIEKMRETIIEYVDKYKENEEITEKQIKDKLSEDFNNNLIVNSVTEEIIKRIDKFQNEYFKWYELVIILIITYFAYCFPYWMILFRKQLAKMSMDDEVIQFQSIILMLMYMDRMTVLNILEFMEQFAVIFKDSIRTCINDYASGDLAALEALKEKERFEPFRRLVDNLIICDKIGLESAFDEIAVDRTNFTEKRKQDNEIHLSDRVIIAKLVTWVPLILTIGLYLIVPFIIASLNELMIYKEELQMI